MSRVSTIWEVAAARAHPKRLDGASTFCSWPSSKGERFVFCGKVRVYLQGISRELLFEAMKKLLVRKCGFVNVPNCKKDPFDEMITAEEMRELRWVEPVIQLPVQYREWTRFGVLRHAELRF